MTYFFSYPRKVKLHSLKTATSLQGSFRTTFKLDVFPSDLHSFKYDERNQLIEGIGFDTVPSPGSVLPPGPHRSWSCTDELTVMMYVYVHYPNHTITRQSLLLHLHSAETLPLRPAVSAYKPFPGLSDSDFTPALPVSPLITLKINPLQNCPAHAIIVTQRQSVFFSSLLLSKWSPITPKSDACHITSSRRR